MVEFKPEVKRVPEKENPEVNLILEAWTLIPNCDRQKYLGEARKKQSEGQTLYSNLSRMR